MTLSKSLPLVIHRDFMCSTVLVNYMPRAKSNTSSVKWLIICGTGHLKEF